MTRSRPEQELQKAVVRLLTAVVPPPPAGPFWFAPDAGVQAGGEHAARIGGIRKAMGVRAGVPDIVVLCRRPFCIELKTETGRASAEQKAVAADLALLGIDTHIVRSIDQLVTVLQAEGVPMRGRVQA